MLPSLWNAGLRASQYGSQLLFGSPPKSDRESDIMDICKLMAKILPLEIVYTILDDAEFWLQSTTSRQGLNSYVATPGRNKAVYLASEPVTFMPTRIRRIVFTMNSNDQGFGGEPEHRGTYEGSWSWFEAVILHPNDHSDLNLTHEAWHVQNNVTASSRRKSHTIIWSRGVDAGEPTDGMQGKHNRTNEFIERLQIGDRIGLVARAMFPAWANHVHQATVTIYYSVF